MANKSIRCNVQICSMLACGVPLVTGGVIMITLEVHPEIHVREQHRIHPYSTCRECHHTFYPKNEDQHCLDLCDTCIDDLRSLREPVISVHVKPRTHVHAR